jgi:hypothetical protein
MQSLAGARSFSEGSGGEGDEWQRASRRQGGRSSAVSFSSDWLYSNASDTGMPVCMLCMCVCVCVYI